MLQSKMYSFFRKVPSPPVFSDGELIHFGKAHRLLASALCLLFILFTVTGINGYSLPAWRSFIDESPPSEIIVGKPRHIRADDWLLDLPLILSQVATSPRFPVVNEKIGLGQNMIVPMNVPVMSSSIFFRPTTWGMAFGADSGIAWMWWAKVLGVFYAYFLVFMILSRSRFYLSSVSALLLVFSPYFQFWSLHVAEIPIHAALGFVSVYYLLFSKKPLILLLNGLLLGWSAVAFVIDFMYPPLQVTCGYFFLFLLAGIVIDRRGDLQWSAQKKVRVVAWAIGVSIVAWGGLSFFSDAKEVIQSVLHTVYPGNRFSSGGGFPVWLLLINNFFVTPFVINWNQVGNVCEASSFFFLFPLVFGAIAWLVISRKSKLDAVSICLLAFVLIDLAYTYLGFPPLIAKLSGWGKTTSNRTQLGLGLANASLLILFLTQYEGKEVFNARARRGALILWGGILVVEALSVREHVALRHQSLLFPTAFAVNLFFAWLLFHPRGGRLLLTCLAALSIVYTIGFNPVVRGGTAYLHDNPLSKEILRLDKEAVGKSRWIVFGDGGAQVLSNLPRIIGVQSLGGYHLYPQMPIWNALDPEGKFAQSYNQCGYVLFQSGSANELKITSPSPGVIQVLLDPRDAVLLRLGIDHFLFEGQVPTSVVRDLSFQKLFKLGNKTVYRRRLPSN